MANRTVLRDGLITVLIWASAFPGIRAGLSAYEPLELILLRFMIASAVLILLCVLMKERRPDPADLPRFVALGFLGITAYQVPLNYGQKTVSSGTASLIINTAPIWATLLSRIQLKERPSPPQLFGLGLGFGGVILITLGQDKTLGVGWGLLLVLLSSFAHAGSFILQKPLLEKYSPLLVTTLTVSFGVVPLLPWMVPMLDAARHAPWPATATVVYLGFFPAALAYVFWNRVVSRLPVSKAASFLYLIPPVAMIIAWVWHGEVPTLVSLMGGLCVLAGVAVVLRD